MLFGSISIDTSTTEPHLDVMQSLIVIDRLNCFYNEYPPECGYRFLLDLSVVIGVPGEDERQLTGGIFAIKDSIAVSVTSCCSLSCVSRLYGSIRTRDMGAVVAVGVPPHLSAA
jgi:hypothetical protein